MSTNRIDEIMDLLGCPKCKGDLIIAGAESSHGSGLICNNCRVQYPIVQGIPIMLIENAIIITK